MKQYRARIANPAAGEREPLAACRRKDNPKLRKADVPRMRWLTEKAVVLCRGLLRKMGLPLTGRRNRLGSLHGPMNHESINGTHPALLVAQPCNSDVQLPYRFPVIAGTHCCDDDACTREDDDDIVEAGQMSQDAQAGHACNYCTKRQVTPFHEVKE